MITGSAPFLKNFLKEGGIVNVDTEVTIQRYFDTFLSLCPIENSCLTHPLSSVN